MKLFLPDTNIFIYAYNGEEPYASSVRDWIKNKSLLISAIVAAEFLSGGEGEDRDKFQSLIDKFSTAAVDTSIVRISADYKHQYKRIKPSFRLPDALIAATCKLYGAILVTNNNNDFPMTDIEKLNLNK